MARSKIKLFVSASALLLVVAATATLIATKNDKANATDHHHHHPVIKSSCSSTLYPELCLSTLFAAPAAALSSVKSTNDVIKLSLNLTITQVEHNYFTINKLIAARNVSLTKREVSLTKRGVSLTKRERTSLHDCLEMVDETLDELRKILRELQNYRSNNNKKSLARQACDVKILLSAAMTNQKTCLDGFSHDRADKKVREKLTQCQTKVFHMCSNALAMVKNMTDSDMASEEIVDDHYHHDTERRLDEKSKSEWPEWLSAGDRRLLQATTVVPDVTVAEDGSGNFQTVAAAVAAAPEGSSRRYIIRIKAGVYRENVEVPKKKINMMFVGDGRTTTIITASRNVVDGSTTFNSATVAVVGDRFLARDITFQNTAGPSKHQAVALRVNADFTAFYRCDMLAYQDTLYVHSLRQFYVSCIIAGTVDFIFGNAAVVFQNCDIHARRPDPNQKNMVTAQGRDDPNQNTGIVIQKCRIGATSDLQAVKDNFQTYLGRPWKMYSRTVVMQSDISDVINPAGWFEWDGNFALDTLFYAEYQNSGAGAGTANRVKWKGYRVLTSAAEAHAFTAGNFIVGGSWLGSTGFPFSLGL